MDLEKTVLPALIIPLIILAGVTIYRNTEDQSSFSFETAIADENTTKVGDGSETFSSIYDCKDASVTSVKNGSTACATPDCYNVTYTPGGVCSFTSTAASGIFYISYTGYNGEGYTAFEQMSNNSYNGYNLASLLPFVVIAMIVVSLLIGALVLR